MDIAISRFSTLSINLLLIFDMHGLNGSFILKFSFFVLPLASSVPVTLILTPNHLLLTQKVLS